MPHVDTPATRIHYRWDGPATGPVLVLSGSLGTDLGLWEPQLPALAERYRVLRYDTRGHGASGVPAGPYDIASLGRDVLALLDALEVRTASFCGISLGGMIGMWLGVNAPERIERLALCNTSAWMGGPAAWEARMEAVRRGGMPAVSDAVIERWFTARFRAGQPQAVERIRRMLLATPPEGYLACCAAVRDMDQRAQLPRIGAPTLVVCGTEDASTPPETARFIAGQVPGARLVALQAAHLSNVEAAPQFTAALRELLGV